MKKYGNTLLGAVVAASLIGCGGSSNPEDSGTDASTILQGVFLDSAVEGLSYNTPSQSGVTDSSGQFNYLAGEQITFSIGSATLPTVTAAAQITPRDLGTADVATNIARLLQSLDQDGFPDNGILIPNAAAATAGQINFSNTVENFANDSVVINLVSNSGSSTTSLISAEQANNHLNESLGADEGSTGGSDNVTLATLAGFYDSTVNSNRQHYLLINSNGSATDYAYDRDSQCYTAEQWQFSSLGGDLFSVNKNRSDESPEEVRIARQNGDLIYNSDNPANRVVLPQVTSTSSTDLQICSTNATPSNTSPTITSHLLGGLTLTVKFSTDMTGEYKTEGEYMPSRSFWQDPRTFIVEFESVQSGGSIRLIPEFFMSVSGEMLSEGLEVAFP